MLPFEARVDLVVMTKKGYSTLPQSSSNTGTTPSDCLMSYPRHSLEESYPSAEKQLVYSTAPVDRVIFQTLKMISQVESFLCPDKQGTPEEGWRIQRPKHYGNKNKDKDNSLKTLTDKNPVMLLCSLSD